MQCNEMKTRKNGLYFQSQMIHYMTTSMNQSTRLTKVSVSVSLVNLFYDCYHVRNGYQIARYGCELANDRQQQ